MLGDASLLAGAECIEGDLALDGTGLSGAQVDALELALANLRFVSGDATYDNFDTDLLFLDALEGVGGQLSMEFNDAMLLFPMDTLRFIVGDFMIDDALDLKTFEKLEPIRWIGGGISVTGTQVSPMELDVFP